MTDHRAMPVSERHAIHSFEYANAAARLAATGFVAGDVTKIALQLSDYSFWVLTAITPTWELVGGQSGAIALSDTAAGWTASNPTLAAGEFGYESDTTRFKIGDGVTAWNSLSHWRYVPEHITVATTGGTTILTVEQNKATSIQTTGVLVSNAIIVVNDVMAPFVAENSNTGAFTTTFKTAAGTGVAISQTTHQMLYADGVNVEVASTGGAGSGDVVGPAIAVSNNVALFDGVTGKLIKDSGKSLIAGDISFPSIGVSGTVKEVLQHVGSAGQISGFAITSGGANLVDVASGEAFVRATAVENGELYHIAIGATTGLSVPSNTTRYIVAKYNAGTPVVTAETLYPTELYTQVYLGEVHNLAGTLHIHNDHRSMADFPNRAQLWLEDLIGTKVVSGEVVSDPTAPSRKIAVSAGVFWDRFMERRTSTSFDSSGAGTFNIFYRDGVGGWTTVATQNTWPNTQYDDGDGTLATLTNNKYGVMFVLREFADGIYLQYGQAEYATQTEAEDALLPTTRPEYLDEHAFYIAKIVFQKSATSPASIIDIRPRLGLENIGVSGSSIHNDLTGIQGGTAGEYYHLTAAQVTVVGNTSGTNTGDQALPTRASLGLDTTDSPQFAGVNLGAASDTTITRTGAGAIAIEGVQLPTISETATLTNKRINPRVGSTTSHATPTINTDNYDIYQLTAQAEAITSFTTNLSGTPVEGQVLVIEITGTAARAITWGASFESSTVTLPSTTVTTAKLTVGFLWNAVTSKWRCVASA